MVVSVSLRRREEKKKKGQLDASEPRLPNRDSRRSTHVHIHSVDTELVSTESQTLEDLVESESLTISNADELVRRTLHLGLDESKQMLLVHRRRVVNVGVDLESRNSISKEREGT